MYGPCKTQHRSSRVKRALLFGLAAQLILISVVFLVFGDQMLPMTRSPLIGIIALGLGVASAFFAWKAPPHPSWIARIGMWLVGFLAVYAAIPLIELVAVLTMAAF